MRRHRLLLFLFFGGILLASTAYLSHSRELVHEGRTLSEWLDVLQRPKSDAEYNEAKRAVQSIGTNAVPHLLGMLQTRGPLKRKLVVLTQKQSIIKSPFPSEFKNLGRAYGGFIALGTNAECALPVLIGWIENRGDKHVDLNTRLRALFVLRLMGSTATNTTSTLIMALQDRDPEIRSKAAHVLGMMAPAPSAVIPALVPLLNDPDAGVRVESIDALSRFDRKAAGAVLALEKACHDPNSDVRRSAESALLRIEPERQWKHLFR